MRPAPYRWWEISLALTLVLIGASCGRPGSPAGSPSQSSGRYPPSSATAGPAPVTSTRSTPTTTTTEVSTSAASTTPVGQAASPTSSSTAGPGPTNPAILVYGNCQTPTLEPSEIVLACADYGLLLEDLRWTSWTDTEASGMGTLVYNDCQPDCAQGHDHDVPDTQVNLTAPVPGGSGQLVWSRLQPHPEPPGSDTGTLDGHPYPLPTRPI
ncbi:MAG: hypothetical protein KGQ66_22070 [Acidobacteriota bacterium]|nr:hypothetical protein [Acidobacteriota bacterium]